MNFVQAVSTCMSKYIVFSGKASRPEFWWFMLAQLLVLTGASFFSETVSDVAAFALLLPTLAVGARRLHDIGKSGWWQLIAFTVVGMGLLIYWWVLPSAKDEEGHEVSQ